MCEKDVQGGTGLLVTHCHTVVTFKLWCWPFKRRNVDISLDFMARFIQDDDGRRCIYLGR